MQQKLLWMGMHVWTGYIFKNQNLPVVIYAARDEPSYEEMGQQALSR